MFVEYEMPVNIDDCTVNGEKIYRESDFYYINADWHIVECRNFIDDIDAMSKNKMEDTNVWYEPAKTFMGYYDTYEHKIKKVDKYKNRR